VGPPGTLLIREDFYEGGEDLVIPGLDEKDYLGVLNLGEGCRFTLWQDRRPHTANNIDLLGSYNPYIF
jgi:hypothetical protein